MNTLENIRYLDSLWFGEFNTWYDWHLVTTKLEINPPDPKTNYIELGGVNGSVDLSEALSGCPVYKNRTIKASFFTNKGTRLERERVLQQISEAIHGKKLKIKVPDSADSYFFGRVAMKQVVQKNYCTEFSVEATCEPWRYADTETITTYEVDGKQEVVLHNYGVATLCPDITVTGSMAITCNGVTTSVTDGSYKIASFKLFQGENTIALSGSGTLTLTYRRATL